MEKALIELIQTPTLTINNSAHFREGVSEYDLEKIGLDPKKLIESGQLGKEHNNGYNCYSWGIPPSVYTKAGIRAGWFNPWEYSESALWALLGFAQKRNSFQFSALIENELERRGFDVERYFLARGLV